MTSREMFGLLLPSPFLAWGQAKNSAVDPIGKDTARKFLHKSSTVTFGGDSVDNRDATLDSWDHAMNNRLQETSFPNPRAETS